MASAATISSAPRPTGLAISAALQARYAATIESFESLINGELDEVPEQAFLNVGSVEQVLAKAKTLQENA